MVGSKALRILGWISCVWILLAGVLSLANLIEESSAFASKLPAIFFIVAPALVIKKYLLNNEKVYTFSTTEQGSKEKKGIGFYFVSISSVVFGAIFLIAGIIFFLLSFIQNKAERIILFHLFSLLCWEPL